MNRLKISLAIVALVAAAGTTMAFKSPNSGNFTNPYWQYVPAPSGPTDPANYMELPGLPDCVGKGEICAIQAPASGSEPVISPSLKSRIENQVTSSGDVFVQGD